MYITKDLAWKCKESSDCRKKKKLNLLKDVNNYEHCKKTFPTKWNKIKNKT